MTQINSQTAALCRAIADAVNGSGLPPCVVGLVLDKLRAQVAQLEAQAIARERQEAEQKEENE